MKKLSLILALALCLSLLAGCAGTPVVYYTNCTCPPADQTPTPAPVVPDNDAAPVEGALKTGLYIATDLGDSYSASGDDVGNAKYDVTLVAVLVDDAGIIRDCVIDGISSDITFGTDGVISTDLTAAPQTKNELGDAYGMVAWGGAVAEWDDQAAALAAFAIGKTAEELRSGAIDETGKAPAGTDLATSATIYLGGLVGSIEKAVANAQHLGAQVGDELRLASLSSLEGSDATGDAAGLAQLNTDAVALTLNGGVITSCCIDSLQAKVNFDTTGTITTDLSAAVLTKNALGENYGMKAWGGATFEWNEQAANFAAYITGKTAADVAGIAITETTKPADGTDLAASVTISIGGFQALIQKAAQ